MTNFSRFTALQRLLCETFLEYVGFRWESKLDIFSNKKEMAFPRCVFLTLNLILSKVMTVLVDCNAKWFRLLKNPVKQCAGICKYVQTNLLCTFHFFSTNSDKLKED